VPLLATFAIIRRLPEQSTSHEDIFKTATAFARKAFTNHLIAEIPLDCTNLEASRILRNNILVWYPEYLVPGKAWYDVCVSPYHWRATALEWMKYVAYPKTSSLKQDVQSLVSTIGEHLERAAEAMESQSVPTDVFDSSLGTNDFIDYEEFHPTRGELTNNDARRKKMKRARPTSDSDADHPENFPTGPATKIRCTLPYALAVEISNRNGGT
jgi:hypothetical protein